MGGRIAGLAICLAVLVGGGACKKKEACDALVVRTMADARADVEPNFRYMQDNALLYDMSLSDYHFVPHTAELNSTGVVRLDRMAQLLKVYGGTVRYQTRLRDEALVTKRMAHVEAFLGDLGLAGPAVEVRPMLAGGRGMSATKAIEINERGPAQDPAAAEASGFDFSASK